MDFNKEKLIADTVFKNYKDMCNQLDMEIKNSTNSKNAQFKELSRYCDYVKDGHKIIIKNVYDEIKERSHGNKGNSSGNIYGDTAQLLILNYLKECSNHVCIGKTNLLEKIGLANKNYIGTKAYPQSLANYLGYNIMHVYDFYNVNDSKLKQIVERALNSLQNKRLILLENVIKLKHINEDIARLAKDYEKQSILLAEKDILDIMNYSDMLSVRRSLDWGKFKNEVKEKLKNECGIEYYYFAYDITINKKYIQDEQKLIEKKLLEILTNDNFDKEHHTSEINNLIINNINECARNRNSDVEKHFNKKEYRLNNDYVESSEKLCSVLINKNTPVLINDIINYKSEAINFAIDEFLPF